MASLPYPPWSAPPTIETRQRHRWLSGAKKKLLKPWKKSQASPNQESKKKLWQQSKYSSYGLQNETDGPPAGFPINFSPFRSALNDHHPFRSPLKMSFSAPTSPEKEEREPSTFEPPSFRSNRPSVHGLFPKESDRTPNIRPPSATSTGSNSSQERTKERRRRRINSAVRPLALPHERKNSSPASLGISLIEHKKPVNLKRKLSLNLPKDAYSYIPIPGPMLPLAPPTPPKHEEWMSPAPVLDASNLAEEDQWEKSFSLGPIHEESGGSGPQIRGFDNFMMY